MKTESRESIPRVREDIEFIPSSYQGGRALLIRDSLGLIQKPLLLKGEILEFLSLIDGKRNRRDLQLELIRQRGGVLITSEEVDKLLLELDSSFLLDSERYQQEKDFETPFGQVKTDKDWVRKLKEAGENVVSPNDIAHSSEHSLEFQLIFLQHLFGSDFSLIPILFGSFRKVLEQVSRPSEIPGMDNFLEALKLSAAERARDTLFVAGVDFSHIGPKFGHDERALSLLLETKNHDKLLIDAVCKADVERFWAGLREIKDRYNVCGFSTIACLLEILSDARGHLLDYDVWQEESTQSAVSFAAIAFEAE